MRRSPYIVVALAAMGLFLYASPAFASGGGECSGGKCGTPKTSGGGGCGCGGGSILINNTDEGDTYQYADDYDEDGHEDDTDNCPFVANKSQVDTDGDLVGDACDVCPQVVDPSQQDIDADGLGDKCDADIDNDGLINAQDNCPAVPNNFGGKQLDTDGDKQGDACDTDDDNDGWDDAVDNCPLIHNPNQSIDPGKTSGKVCDNDDDGDNIPNAKDSCPLVANTDQKDSDGDKVGDDCDLDKDNDGVLNRVDNCPDLDNKDQKDADRDGKGDACDERFCFVVGGDKDNCLDPGKTFKVYSPDDKWVTGEEFRLRLFANRKDAPIQYTWVIEERPSGSSAAITNPKGSVRYSNPYEYRYQADGRVTFTPDEPGTYKIKVNAELIFGDTVQSSWPTDSSHTMVLEVEGDSMGGCSVGKANTTLGAMMLSLLGIFFAVRRRRRR